MCIPSSALAEVANGFVGIQPSLRTGTPFNRLRWYLFHSVQSIMAPAASWTECLRALVSIHQAVNPGSRQGHGHADMGLPLLFWSGFNTDFPGKYSLLSLRPWRINICCSPRLSLGIMSSMNTCDASTENEFNFYFPLREK